MYVPWPTTWSRFRNRGGLILTVLIVYALVAAFLILVLFANGNPSAALIVLQFAGVTLVGGVAAYGSTGLCSNRGTYAFRRARLRNGTFAIVLPAMKSLPVIMLGFFALLAVLLFTFPWLIEHSQLTNSWRSAYLRSWAPFAPILGVSAVIWSLGSVVRKRWNLGIGLSPEGVYHFAWFGACFYRWDWIRAIRPIAPSSPQIVLDVIEPDSCPADPEENWVAQLHSYRRKSTTLSVNQLAVNPGVAYIALVFYHRHPECRHELATDDGVTRIQKLDFPELIRELEKTGRLRSRA